MRFDSLIQKLGRSSSRLRNSKSQRVAAPTLREPVRFPYGPFQFKAAAPKGLEFQIEATSDLKTWTSIAQGNTSAEGVDYIDSDASKFGHRFYRVTIEGMRSTNVIGYAAVTLPPGFSMIANPLEAPNNTVSALFQGWPDGTTLNKFDTRIFRLTDNEVRDGKWLHASDELLPGHGAIFFNPTSEYKSLSFVGEVMQGNLSIPIPSGFSVRSSIVPQPGHLLDDLQFPISEGDVIHIFDRDHQKYVLHPYENGKWKAGQPVLNVGESFWVAKTAAGNWSRSLVLNQ